MWHCPSRGRQLFSRSIFIAITQPITAARTLHEKWRKKSKSMNRMAERIERKTTKCRSKTSGRASSKKTKNKPTNPSKIKTPLSLLPSAGLDFCSQLSNSIQKHFNVHRSYLHAMYFKAPFLQPTSEFYSVLFWFFFYK